MATDLKPIRVPDFEGGLFLGEKSLAKDNQLTVLTNWYYDADKKLRTRRGQRNFGSPVPEAAKVIHNCDSVAGNGTWAGTDDAVTITADASGQKLGAAAIKFNITVATSASDFATVTNSTMTAVDITTTKGHIGFWVKVPTGAKTNLTDCRLRVGSSAANYYEFTILPAGLTEGSYVFIKLLFSSATTTGTPVDTSINYLLFKVNYTAAYTDKVDWEFDDIVAYSVTATKAMMSLKYFEESISPFTRHLLTNVGTTFYEYDETSGEWTSFKPGLTTGTRFAMSVYKNIMSLSNGVDNYFDWTGKIATDRTGANTYKAKFLLMANDIGYALGDPTVPSSLAYTSATPANLQTYPNVLVLDEDSSDGKGTGLINLGPVIIACKEKKIYKVNVATPSREQLDYSDGALSDRALTRVENEVFISNKSGIYTLAQREATTGSLRSTALSDDIQPFIDEIAYHEIASAIYVAKLNNWYFFCDTNADQVPDTCIVFSVLTRKWTKYTNISANEAVIYKDSAGDEHFLIANANNGQCKEIEYGFNDNGVEIASYFETKDFDFGIPETYKTFETVEVQGFISSSGSFDAASIIDDTETAPATINGVDYISGSGSSSYGSYAFGTTPYGGSNNTVTLYPFVARIPMYETGQRIRLKITVNTKDTILVITKASIYPFAQPLDIFATANKY